MNTRPFDVVPEADWLEQTHTLDTAGGLLAPEPASRVPVPRDAPEADRLEQAQPVGTVDDPLSSAGTDHAWDAPVADWLEQAFVVPFGDDHDVRDG
ncbi:hypothetical protein ACFWAY_44910 [Rhodococcus sp. NPDC059968]|uniref:hypothetical protein n=1 Tax=Rhodococcus sp. NPDC059968 TaxID=3347017 RepID=UPI00366D799D